MGFGGRPAILVVDLARAWTDPQSPLGCDLSAVLRHTSELIAAARAFRVPVFFTIVGFEPDMRDCGEVILKKKPILRMLVRGSRWSELDASLDVRSDDVVITKQHPSAFFGTGLLSLLIAQRIDTLILIGCSTSGCIRATAQDAHDYNFHVIVPREAVGERSASGHQAALFDIDARMGDVLPFREVLAYLEELENIAVVHDNTAAHCELEESASPEIVVKVDL